MRAKGTLLALVAGGLLLLAPNFEGARADHKLNQHQKQTYGHNGHSYAFGKISGVYFGERRHRGDHVHRRHGGGHFKKWHGRSQFKKWRRHGGSVHKLSRRDHKKLKRIRHRFHSERAFRRHLRHHKPRLFARYINNIRHRDYRHSGHWDDGDDGRHRNHSRRYQLHGRVGN